MNRIAICGKIKSGKSLLARHLSSKYGYKEFNFADSLKDICKQLGLSHEQLYNQDEKTKVINSNDWKNGLTSREIMIKVGMMFRENIDEDIWITTLLSKSSKYDKIVIGDLRFDNEYSYLKRNGFIIIKIKRDDINANTNTNKYVNSHISERTFDDELCDYVLENNGTKEQLYDMAITILQQNNID